MSEPGAESKRVFSENLKYYIARSGKTSTEIAKNLDIPVGTFFDWVKAKTYPRIDKIELLTQYFGIKKSDLVEEHPNRSISESPADSRDVFAGNLRMNLAKCGKSRQEVSQEIGVSYSTFSEWCNGRKFPRIEKIELLAQYFDISVSELVGSETVTVEADASDNRAVFSENLRFYMKKSGKIQKEVAQVIGVSTATFNDWMKGKKYPRIEKIELLAKYFGATKADLIEKRKITESKEPISDSRETFVANLRFYMAKAHKSRKDVSEAIGVSYFTFSDWCNGKKYPRIEKLEALAEYFGISVPELIGEQKDLPQEENTQIGKDEVLHIILRLHTDAEFLRIVEKMSALDNEKLKALKQFLMAFGE